MKQQILVVPMSSAAISAAARPDRQAGATRPGAAASGVRRCLGRPWRARRCRCVGLASLHVFLRRRARLCRAALPSAPARVDPQHQPVRQPHVDGLDVALQQAALAFERGQPRPGARRLLLRQQHVDRIVDAHVPAAVVDPHRGADPGGEFRLAPQHLEQRGGMAGGTLADDRRQLGEAAEILDRDHLALVVDQLQLAAVLPDRQRVALGRAGHTGCRAGGARSPPSAPRAGSRAAASRGSG